MSIKDNNWKVLEIAFERLRAAEARFHFPTTPHVPLGRPRVFKIGRLYWPVRGGAPGSLVPCSLADIPWPNNVRTVYLTPLPFEEAISSLLNWTGDQPRRVWRMIRQINAVIAWCEKRAEGRRRAALEILRQQQKWIDKIVAEVTLERLAKGTMFVPKADEMNQDFSEMNREKVRRAFRFPPPKHPGNENEEDPDVPF